MSDTHTSPTARGIVIMIAVLVATPAIVGPVAAAPDLDGELSDQLVNYETGDGLQPSVIVEYDDREALQAWTEESPAREIVDDMLGNRSVVAAPRHAAVDMTLWDQLARFSDAGFSVFGADPLEDQSWVSDVDPNTRLSLPDPVGALSRETDWSTPTDSFSLGSLSAPDYPTDGVAFNGDVNETTLAEARSTIGEDNQSVDGSGTVVGVIDTGANVANGEVFGNGTSGSTIRIADSSKNFITGETVADQGYSAIEDGSSSLHGTWTAAAIAANTSNSSYDGVAEDSELVVAKALSDDGSGETADISAAVRYMADNTSVDVISMSLGSPFANPELRESISYAYDNGVSAVVVATGNSRPARGANIAAPAHHSPTIAVAATTTNDTPGGVESAYFSQAGPDPGTTDRSQLDSAEADPDVGAPGVKVEALIPTADGFTQRVTLSGTSMATPLVAGGVGGSLASNATLANLNHTDLHDRIRETARPAPDVGTHEIGAGVVGVDTLVSGDAPDTDQSEALTDAALTRDRFYEAHSDAQGGWLASLPVLGE